MEWAKVPLEEETRAKTVKVTGAYDAQGERDLLCGLSREILCYLISGDDVVIDLTEAARIGPLFVAKLKAWTGRASEHGRHLTILAGSNLAHTLEQVPADPRLVVEKR